MTDSQFLQSGASTPLLLCPACNQKALKEVGALPKMYGVFELPIPGNLYQCNTCFLLFRHPYPSESEIEKAYNNFSSTTWSDSLKRVDFELAIDYIHKTYQTGNIMDIGCYDGKLLNKISDRYKKYGVEISIPARKAAQQNGIVLIGTSINNIEVSQLKFHVIILMDVIEHLPRPMEALKKVVDLLLPGGVVIISTGNADELLWKLMRRNYWYYYPEHVTFTGRRWFDWAAKQLGLDMVMFKKIPHVKGTLGGKWQQLMNCLFFKMLEVIRPYGWFYNMTVCIYPFNRVKNWAFAPVANFLKDHMFIVLRHKRDF